MDLLSEMGVGGEDAINKGKPYKDEEIVEIVRLFNEKGSKPGPADLNRLAVKFGRNIGGIEMVLRQCENGAVIGKKDPSKAQNRIQDQIEKAKVTLMAVAEAEIEEEGGKPELVILEELVVPTEYQRGASEKVQRYIVGNFNKKACTPLILSERADGSRVILDGQNRRSALLILGFRNWWAIIHRGLTIQEEAQIFEDIQNKRYYAKPGETFKAGYARGDKARVEIVDTIDAYGFILYSKTGQGKFMAEEVIGNYPRAMADGVKPSVGRRLKCVKAVEAIHRRGLLMQVLEVISEGTKPTDQQATNSRLVVAISIFLQFVERSRTEPDMYPESFVLKRLKQVVSERGEGWDARMKNAAKGRGRIATNETAAYNLYESYNCRLRGPNRLPIWEFKE